ncbi:MAG: hypothetical protein AMQ74_01757 [Candidatus Methanofastidiosum methylothiophilum]|uniref:Uncharacterized protein n=1 Tax=Candidatus Methanofastidiosum methylothiophilum TaxID=1705564 RepID=A0A150IPM1_9EURY|nr:MAG: hypothetical protein AMQ74_01757 [Candidatus Methanofastidiosum methylthiophilus]
MANKTEERLNNWKKNNLGKSVYGNEEEMANADISDFDGPMGLALVSSIITRWKAVEIKPMEVFTEAKKLDPREKTLLFRTIVRLGFLERVYRNNNVIEMYKKEWDDIIEAVLVNVKVNEKEVYIPENSVGIIEGYYTLGEIIVLLKAFNDKPEIIQFLAEMMEDYEIGDTKVRGA